MPIATFLFLVVWWWLAPLGEPRTRDCASQELLDIGDNVIQIDNFWLLGVAILVMVPMVFLMKRPRAGGALAVH